MSDLSLGEVLLFTKIADYEARPAFTAALTLSAGQVDRIVAKYELPPDRASWAKCGLNNCHTEHRLGYVIRAKDGRETNIGQDCGKRELGVSFEEVVATFKRAEDAQARQRAIQALLDEKPALVERSERAVAMGATCGSQLSAFIQTFDRLNGFWREVVKAAKQGGIVRAPLKRDTTFGMGGGKEQLTTVGRFNGGAVLVTELSSAPKLVDQLVVPWLASLSSERLATLSEAELGQVVREAARMRDLIARAESFVENCAALLTGDNIAGLESICDEILRASDAGTARPVLHAWILEARTTGVPKNAVRIHRPSPRW